MNTNYRSIGADCAGGVPDVATASKRVGAECVVAVAIASTIRCASVADFVRAPKLPSGLLIPAHKRTHLCK